MDCSLRSALKKGLRLPNRTISDFLYCHQDDGGLGVPSIEDEMDIALVSQAFKFLANERDPWVSDVARHQLTEVMCKRTQSGKIHQPEHLTSASKHYVQFCPWMLLCVKQTGYVRLSTCYCASNKLGMLSVLFVDYYVSLSSTSAYPGNTILDI